MLDTPAERHHAQAMEQVHAANYWYPGDQELKARIEAKAKRAADALDQARGIRRPSSSFFGDIPSMSQRHHQPHQQSYQHRHQQQYQQQRQHQQQQQYQQQRQHQQQQQYQQQRQHQHKQQHQQQRQSTPISQIKKVDNEPLTRKLIWPDGDAPPHSY